MYTFVESGMTFGPYIDGHCFHVEASDTYRVIQENVQIAEFLLLRPRENASSRVLIVEAKSSSPRPKTQPNFDDFIAEIRDKLTNALAVGVACILKRHPTAAAELPDVFRDLDLAATEFRLVLIISGHKREWLQPLQDALRIALQAAVQTWSLGPLAVVVMNHEIARGHGIISAP